MSSVLKVFLLDDHEIVRRGVRELIETDGDLVVVGEAGSAEEADEVIASLAELGELPDVAVLDVQLGADSSRGARSGIEVCRDIRSAHPSVACLMLTSFADDEALLDSVIAGAQGYVLKQVRGVELLDDIRRVAGGASLLAQEVVNRVRQRLRERAAEDALLAGLTDRERSILELFAEGLTNREIGERLFVSEKTVKNNMSNVLMKLGMQRRTEAALYASRHLDGRPR